MQEQGFSRQPASLGYRCHSFFEGAPAEYKIKGDAPSPSYVNEFVSSEDGLRLIKAFMRIARSAVRHRIVNVVQEIAVADGE
jgi:hypothetical protein